MNDMEMTAVREMRAQVPTLTGPELTAAEARFTAATRDRGGAGRWLGMWRLSGRGPARSRGRRYAWRAGLAGGLAGAAAVAAVAVGGLPGDGGGRHDYGPRATDPWAGSTGLRLVSAADVLDGAARTAAAEPELNPRPEQFLRIESTTLYQSTDVGREVYRYLYATNRRIWLSVDGTRTGALEVEELGPRAIPGQRVSPDAAKAGEKWTAHIKGCPVGSRYRRDLGAARNLPADPTAMLAHLRRSPGDKAPDERAWTAAGDLLRESYVPSAQRAAVFGALKLLPGVTAAEGVRDATGRTGVAVAYYDKENGTNRQLIFDPGTYRYLGEREVVMDPNALQLPIGTLVAGTAQLSVAVADAPAQIPPDEVKDVTPCD